MLDPIETISDAPRNGGHGSCRLHVRGGSGTRQKLMIRLSRFSGLPKRFNRQCLLNVAER